MHTWVCNNYVYNLEYGNCFLLSCKEKKTWILVLLQMHMFPCSQAEVWAVVWAEAKEKAKA